MAKELNFMRIIEDFHKRITETYASTFGARQFDGATNLDKQAETLCDQGGYAAALPFYEQAFAIREQTLGPGHPHTAASLNNLALLYNRLGNYKAALRLCQRALKICEQTLGPYHPDTATSLNNLAETVTNQGDYEAALPLYERALAIREQTLDPLHPDTAASSQQPGSAPQDAEATTKLRSPCTSGL